MNKDIWRSLFQETLSISDAEGDLSDAVMDKLLPITAVTAAIEALSSMSRDLDKGGDTLTSVIALFEFLLFFRGKELERILKESKDRCVLGDQPEAHEVIDALLTVLNAVNERMSSGADEYKISVKLCGRMVNVTI